MPPYRMRGGGSFPRIVLVWRSLHKDLMRVPLFRRSEITSVLQWVQWLSISDPSYCSASG